MRSLLPTAEELRQAWRDSPRWRGIQRTYKAEESKAVWLCGCKQTHNQPLCDGSHKALL